ncbi:transcriptional regulator : : SmpA_OmlA [Tuwongella immobilis]|uniref:Transcriptional regulator:: SmpA_OmlA n=2 Tax=Tuwongella immobilis TaxID=692036 RepID=A0A6C2YRC5_9BACT|nr:transcriptional regulator : : SmpA_OmlA [Tuwongella immobilis]VTS04694.1 transcriptional regulator : : SmpA_OmlA [Tuwongella immobilis]
MLFAFDPGPGPVILLIPLSLIVTGIFSVKWCLHGYQDLRAQPTIRWCGKGIVQLVAGVLIWPALYVGPCVLFRINHGTDPISWDDRELIRKGMTMDEVQAILGPPIVVENRKGDIVWIYYSDPLYINDDLYQFSQSGKMVNHWFH